ncbi:hypothetical protein PAXRUDRAFT_651394 [Paxillus rubicundulus Ve08.2h10]|uniref:Uncharacterized protein n=1 Tax=Paxillus rubicundulus Ve08.2h10 TaxID=930991 RepID=A0A0D0C9P3_9AGAM|nr:hypothetical protein PAXRUDRAFT_651394 [Paxillus rubicundulus Ve08.2h10]
MRFHHVIFVTSTFSVTAIYGNASADSRCVTLHRHHHRHPLSQQLPGHLVARLGYHLGILKRYVQRFGCDMRFRGDKRSWGLRHSHLFIFGAPVCLFLV